MRVLPSLLFSLLLACGGAPSSSGSAPSALALPNQAEAEPGVITGGPPSEADLEAAAAAGFTLVISLRTHTEGGLPEERETVERLGMRFAHVPIDGPDDLTVENARRVDSLLAAADGPAIVHCGSGNRAGAIMALRAFLRGDSIDAAIEHGVSAGLRGLEDATRARLTRICEEDPERRC